MIIITVAIILSIICVVPAIAVPVSLDREDNFQKFAVNISSKSLGDGIPLRPMPLGASITYGQGSTDGNGYREHLRSAITDGGNLVNMVGTRKAGTMKDNDVEGWPGYRIDQIVPKARVAVPEYKPNVILVNAGTNDAVQNKDIPNAGSRMEGMINNLFEDSPKATVILSTLIINLNANAEKNVKLINVQYKALADRLQGEGKHVVLADMHGADGPQKEDMHDDTHPDDEGHAKMAAIWYRALEEASDNGWLVKAEDIGIPDDGAA